MDIKDDYLVLNTVRDLYYLYHCRNKNSKNCPCLVKKWKESGESKELKAHNKHCLLQMNTTSEENNSCSELKSLFGEARSLTSCSSLQGISTDLTVSLERPHHSQIKSTMEDSNQNLNAEFRGQINNGNKESEQLASIEERVKNLEKLVFTLQTKLDLKKKECELLRIRSKKFKSDELSFSSIDLRMGYVYW